MEAPRINVFVIIITNMRIDAYFEQMKMVQELKRLVSTWKEPLVNINEFWNAIMLFFPVKSRDRISALKKALFHDSVKGSTVDCENLLKENEDGDQSA